MGVEFSGVELSPPEPGLAPEERITSGLPVPVKVAVCGSPLALSVTEAQTRASHVAQGDRLSRSSRPKGLAAECQSGGRKAYHRSRARTNQVERLRTASCILREHHLGRAEPGGTGGKGKGERAWS